MSAGSFQSRSSIQIEFIPFRHLVSRTEKHMRRPQTSLYVCSPQKISPIIISSSIMFSILSRGAYLCAIIVQKLLTKIFFFAFLFSAGRTARCSRYRLCPFGDGYRGRCRSRVERGAVFRAEKLQITRRENTTSIRKPNTVRASKHSQISPLLDGYA